MDPDHDGARAAVGRGGPYVEVETILTIIVNRSEQSAGGPETNPDDDRPPKSGFPSKHPRSDEKPYEPGH